MIKRTEGPTIVYTGGGTAGHIFPGLAVLEETRKLTGDRCHHCWIASRRGMDRRLVENAGISFYAISSGKLRRYVSLRNLADAFRVAAGLVQAYVLMKKLKPAVVFSKGGYVTVPVVLAARLLKIPVISHESDAEPGLATRMNGRFSSRILVSYPETIDCFPSALKPRIEVSGNPVRPEILSGDPRRGRELSGPGPEPLVLVLGGSQGARQINNLIAGCLPALLRLGRVVHQHGNWDAPPEKTSGYLPRDFISEELSDFMAAADLIVCRAGASTLWEVATLSKPSILIPLGTASSRGDQIANARIFQRKGASLVLEGDPRPEDLEREIAGLLGSPDRLKAMGQAAGNMVQRNAAVYIARILYEEVE
ncbi:MAG: undecaprenyldiphospho-muramoylpentapeptide beta-N-acetylglucosaminyltransferase [Spirochaetales bacterium]|nr:undecaprenyldiphospho-muramoylpentapeptide beta-N-acetylglucosaminyltransferase [Spirochaetales bacterium]